MAILNNNSLGFSEGEENCDCRSNDFCQIVVKEDNPAWQIVSEGDEVTGTNIKLPCETNIVGSLIPSFPNYNPAYVQVNNTSIIWSGNQTSATHGRVTSITNLITTGKFYVVRFTIVGRTKGFLSLLLDLNSNTFNANGTYTVTGKAAQNFLEWNASFGETAFDGTVINLSVSCIRYSTLYTIADTSEGGIWTPSGQTKLCKQAGNTGSLTYNDNDAFIPGQTYRICFTITDLTQGSVNAYFGNTLIGTYSQNGRYCEDVLYSGPYSGKSLWFDFSSGFDGCFGDVSAHINCIINARLIDSDGNEVENGIITTPIENTLKVELNDTLPEGCYRIQVADSCANYKNQFYGDIFEDNRYTRFSETLNTTTGYRAIPTNGAYTDTIKYIGAICCGKTYDMAINGIYGGDTGVLYINEITVNIGGLIYNYFGTGGPISSPFEIPFLDIEAGCENEDIEIFFDYEFTDITSTGQFINFQFNQPATYLEMQPNQFCPQATSLCLKVLESAEKTCDTLLIKYRSSQDAFGFDYTSSGYTEADGFYNQLRIPAKVWKSAYPKTKEVQKLSNGRRNAYYTDIDKKYTLSTGYLPEYIHDALSNAVDHEILIIDGKEYVSEQTDYSPQWNKASALAPVEVELFLQKPRTLSTLC